MTPEPADPPAEPTDPPREADPAPIELTPAAIYHPAPIADDPLGDLTADSPDRPAAPLPAEPPSGRWKVWLAVGVLLQALAAGLWYFYITGRG